MKRRSFIIAVILAVVVLLGMFIFDNNPITNKQFCLTNQDCRVYRVGECCDFIAINAFNYQTAHKYEMICDSVCPEYETRCIDFRCELDELNVLSPELGLFN